MWLALNPLLSSLSTAIPGEAHWENGRQVVGAPAAEAPCRPMQGRLGSCFLYLAYVYERPAKSMF